jgi:predicted histone-like DNA-binding protein
MGKVLIKKYQYNNEKNETAHRKWFGRVVHMETVDLDGMCRHMITHGTIFTEDVVVGVVKKFVSCIQELLLESKKVKLDGIGTFYLACKSLGVDDVDDYVPRKHITNLKVRFSGDRSKLSGYKKAALLEAANLTDLSTLGFALAEGDGTPSGGSTGSGTVNDEP